MAIDLGIYGPNSAQGKKSASIMANTQKDMLERMINQEVASFDGSQHTNFDSIIRKYPHLSKDVIIGLVKAGANADTPGIDKVASVDGIQQVMRSATYTKELPSMFKNDKSLFSKLKDLPYAALKTTTRVGFAALRSPYDYFTTAARDIYAISQGEKGAAKALVDDLNPANIVLGKTSQFGSIIRDVVGGQPGLDTGSGFFVAPESRVGTNQAKAMSAIGKVNGQSFTIGRGSMAVVGADPNSTQYKLASGVIDAVFNVGLDPSSYVGVGFISKVGVLGAAKTGKAAAAAKITAQAEQDAKRLADIARLKDAASLTPEEIKLQKAALGAKGEILRAVQNNLSRAEEDLINANRYLADANVLASGKKADAVVNAVDPEVVKGVKALDEANLTNYVQDIVVSGRQSELIDRLSQLSADSGNIQKAFPGAFMVDELPEAGKIVPAAHGADEFLVSAAKKDGINVVDLSRDYSKLTTAEVDLELKLRARLSDEIKYAISDTANSKATRTALQQIDGSSFYDDIFGGEGVQNLGTLIGSVAATKNTHAVALLTNMIEDIWKADAFANVRAIHGGTGGFAIVAPGAIAARGIKMSEALADSASLGIYNVPKSLVEAKDAVASAKAAQEEAILQKANIDRQLKEISALRDYTSMDPELVQNIVNSLDYAPLKKLADLEMKVSDANFYKEYLRVEAGLVKDGIGGPLAEDITSVNKFLLGKRFGAVAEIVAKQTSASAIARLFNNKMDLALAGDLAKATEVDEVLAILRAHLADPVTDPQLARSLALRGQAFAASKPMIKHVLPPEGKAINAVQKMEQALSRIYIRSAVLPLDDLDRLGNGLREWMQSAEVPVSMIDETIDELISATASTSRNVNVARAAIIDKALRKSQEVIANKYAPGNAELLKILQDQLTLGGKEIGLIKNYAVSLHANGKLPFINIADGQKVTQDAAVYAYQFLDDVVRLPSTKPIVQAIRKYDKSGPLIGKRAAGQVLQTELGEHWRTAQLAFRVSYVLRNIGEMQVRQYLSGHDTMLNHPLSYFAMMMANPNGTGFKKWLTHVEKYGNDIMGNSFKDPEGAKYFAEAVDEHLEMMGRSIAAADPRSADPVARVLGKIYTVVDSEHPEFIEAYSNTLARFNLDDMMQLVAKADTTELQAKLVNDLMTNKEIIINNQKRTNVLEDLLKGANVGKTPGDPSDFDKIFLKNPEAGFSYDNLSPEGITNWLFDETSTGSYAHALGNLMGNGQKGIYIRKLLADGSVEVPLGNNKFETIIMPRYKNSDSFEDGGVRIAGFKKQLEKLFPKEDMPGAQGILSETKAWTSDTKSMLKQGVDTFFEWAAKWENIANFGPEYRMSYWDHIGRYAPALDLKDLLKAQKMAEETLAPIRTRTLAGKYIPVGKRHQTLRIIRREIRARQKNLDFKAPMTLDDAHVTAARMAGQATKELFYDASRTLDATNKMRLIFPFLQAHMNTIKSWGTLVAKNPVQVYKFGKAFDALTKPGTGAIYDITNTKYEEGDGFFYKDEFNTTRFRYPLLGNVLGMFAGKSITDAQALQLTAPVESLNLAFGSTNPLMPGVGPMAQAGFMALGGNDKFGGNWDFARQWIFPFGPPNNTVTDLVVPAWLNKSFLLLMNDQSAVEKGIKGWAGYLASTGKYGDNPLGNDQARSEMFNEAQTMSRWAAFGNALFQSILPATPTQEILNKIKTPEGKYQFAVNTVLYKAWEDSLTENAGDYDASVMDFAEKFGEENLLVILSNSTKAVRGTKDAWSFLNKYPDVVDQFATRDADIVPYMFPGGEAAMAYYNWQKSTKRRTALSKEDILNAAENLVYNLEKSRITKDQIDGGYSDIWYTQQMIELNKKYGGQPVSEVTTGAAFARATNIGLALQNKAFQMSPIYDDTVEFYTAFDNAVKNLQENRNTVTPDFGSTFWATSMFREELQQLGTKIMLRNPEFSHLYYSVFAPLLKAQG